MRSNSASVKCEECCEATHRLDVWEVTLLVVASVGLTLIVAERRTQRLLGSAPPPFASLLDEQLDATLRVRYGPHHQSNGPEEWIIREFFQDRRGGVFVDVGAWHWESASNTYFLEHDLGWSGLAIDASSEFADGWRRHRPRSRFVIAFVDAADGAVRTYHTGANTQTSSGTQEIPDQFGGGAIASREVTTARLDTLLDRAGVHSIDLLSMDIELSEPAALAGFSIARWRPQLVCIEAYMPAREPILEYFARAGYVVIGKYLRYDTQNLYFQPLRGTPE